MQLVAGWNREDRHNLDQFFRTPSGARLIETLRINAPKVTGKTVEERAMTGTARQTWEDAVNAIAVLIGTDPDDKGSMENLQQFDPNAFSSAPVRPGR
jgi:acetylornithine deacetylase/succinyl-diaminopimelate desuccinylase-like protein